MRPQQTYLVFNLINSCPIRFYIAHFFIVNIVKQTSNTKVIIIVVLISVADILLRWFE
jgi:hypothetical protein